MLAFVAGRVAVLDDPRDATVLAADDAPETEGFVHDRGEDRRRGILDAVLGRELGDGLGAHERRVARQHEDVVVGVEIVEHREGDAHGVAGAALDPLLHELDRHLGDELLLQRLGDVFGGVADDDDDPFERKLGQGVDDVEHHRTAAQRVQHLGRAASASACPRPRRARRRRAGGTDSCSPPLLGGEGSNLDSGLQRTLCCRYTTPESH